MSHWQDTLSRVEALEDLSFDTGLVARLERLPMTTQAQHFYTPSFKNYQSSELSCGKSAWPAISITGGDCALQCDHCKAKILEPMLAARSPDALWRLVNQQIEQGAEGMLLTGGSNIRNEVEYDSYYPIVRKIKDQFPAFRIAVHTALVSEAIAQRMEDAGIDVAMMDVIGAQDTITQVYHLKRKVEDFERTLEALVHTKMRVVPHIVIGLHYGHLLGEWNALEIIARKHPDAVVLVVVMPFYAPEIRPFVSPDVHAVGSFFHDARAALPDTPLLLGCARPAGQAKLLIDSYAVMAGISGIAHPADGVVELAARLGRHVRVSHTCCSMAVGDEIMQHPNDLGVAIDLDTILQHERHARAAKKPGRLQSIPIVVA